MIDARRERWFSREVGEATFQLSALWLDDAEFVAVLRELSRVLLPAATSPPRPGRSRRVLATVLLPGEKAGDAGPPPAPTAGRALKRKRTEAEAH